METVSRQAEATMIDVSIIIVNWNAARYLQRCLKSILHGPVSVVLNPQGTGGSYSHPTVELLVVDCGSSDGSLNLLRTYPQVKTVALPENIGFSRASNLGLAQAKGRHLLLLNPDTEVLGDAIATVVNYLDTHPDAGVVGPHVLNTDGSTQPTKHRFHNSLTILYSLEIDGMRKRRSPKCVSDYYYYGGFPDTAVLDVDWVSGCALFVRSSVYMQLGGLDEQFFMYYEDVDWCRRIKNAGWRIVYLGTARVIHHQGKSSVQAPGKARNHYEDSKIRYFRKYHGKAAEVVLRILLRVNSGFPRATRFLQDVAWRFLEHRWFTWFVET